MSSNLTIQHHNVDFFSHHLPTILYFILLHPIPDCPWEPVTFAVTPRRSERETECRPLRHGSLRRAGGTSACAQRTAYIDDLTHFLFSSSFFTKKCLNHATSSDACYRGCFRVQPVDATDARASPSALTLRARSSIRGTRTRLVSLAQSVDRAQTQKSTPTRRSDRPSSPKACP